jgi:uncharacterized protein YjbI with pentapeptide repeats
MARPSENRGARGICEWRNSEVAANPVRLRLGYISSCTMKHNLREILHVHDTDVTDSHFANANLVHCRFQKVNFSHSKFTCVDFSEVSFADVDLTNASITDANLAGMKINGILVSDLLTAYQASIR